MMLDKKQLQARIYTVQEKIEKAAIASGRNFEDITLVAATKMNDTQTVKTAIEAGIQVCGENRVQELLQKHEENAYLGADLHFIGTLQSNKVKHLIGKTSLIQSVNSIHLGQIISKEAQKKEICQDILLEINIGREESKSGLLPDALDETIAELSEHKNIHIRGLMVIPPIANEVTKNSRYFDEIHQVFIDIKAKKYDNVSMDYLSMGMTNDFETAIFCGSNMVRIGTALFGARPYPIALP